MNYSETLDWMFAQLPMYQRQGATAFKKDLTNSIAFSKHLNFPEKQFKTIHVAGTNGKGSTSHMLSSILQEAGYRVGLYTSPHLKDFRERIKVNGIELSEKNVTDFIENNQAFLKDQKLSFFEMTVGMAFDFFADQKVDIAIVEVGLGGRLDSTNIVEPIVSVITNIGLDHTQFLGETIREIAFEKAGIIKPNIPVVIGEKQKDSYEVFQERSSSRNSPMYLAEETNISNYPTDLMGAYQLKNVKTALRTVELLRQNEFDISIDSLQKGFANVVKNTGLKGRWQVLKQEPKVICDTAHNKEGLTQVLNQLRSEKFKKLHIVLGTVSDKDLDSILPLFPSGASYYFCMPDIPRGMQAEVLKNKAEIYNLIGEVYESVSKAYDMALTKAKIDDLIYIGGSTFVVAELPL